MKLRYHRAVSVQSSIDRNIQLDERYSWAKSPGQLHRFQAAVSALEKAIDSERFSRFWVTNTVDDVKKEFGSGLTTSLTAFTGAAVTDAIEVLEEEQSRFNKMHISNHQV